jgi:type VI secretion system secreted protein Hcp
VATHKNELEVTSFSWGLSNTSDTVTGATRVAGKAQFSDVSMTGSFRGAGPKLMVACAKGQHFKTVTLSGMANVGTPRPVDALRIVLSDVVISQFSVSGSDGDVPMETLSLAYGKVQVNVVAGATSAVVSGGWDLLKNVAVTT